MNIIFGREQAEAMQSKYTILELDTFKIGDQIVTAFCAVGGIPILEMPKVESMKSLHANLLENYRKGDWNYCEQAIEHLSGFWDHELDTFYDTITKRMIENKDRELDSNWWIIEKNPTQADQL
jgi:hypothetical protein